MVYYAKVFPFLEEGAFFAHRRQIEERRWQDITGKKNREAGLRSLAAGILLHRGLCAYFNCPPESTPPFQTKCGQWGKPYLADYPGVYFNLSHSGEYACCAVAGCETGVDIQKHQKIKTGLAERFFTKEDQMLLEGLTGKEKEERFFRIWSVRESFVKFTGRGIGQGLDSFAIDWQNKALLDSDKEPLAYFRENLELEGCSMCVCAPEREMNPTWVRTELWEGSGGERNA